MKVIKAIKKPIEVECVQWTGLNRSEIEEFLGWENTIFYYYRPVGANAIELKLEIITHLGRVKVDIDDYIAKELNGDIYSYSKKDFMALYDVIGYDIIG